MHACALRHQCAPCTPFLRDGVSFCHSPLASEMAAAPKQHTTQQSAFSISISSNYAWCGEVHVLSVFPPPSAAARPPARPPPLVVVAVHVCVHTCPVCHHQTAAGHSAHSQVSLSQPVIREEVQCVCWCLFRRRRFVATAAVVLVWGAVEGLCFPLPQCDPRADGAKDETHWWDRTATVEVQAAAAVDGVCVITSSSSFRLVLPAPLGLPPRLASPPPPHGNSVQSRGPKGPSSISSRGPCQASSVGRFIMAIGAIGVWCVCHCRRRRPFLLVVVGVHTLAGHGSSSISSPSVSSQRPQQLSSGGCSFSSVARLRLCRAPLVGVCLPVVCPCLRVPCLPLAPRRCAFPFSLRLLPQTLQILPRHTTALALCNEDYWVLFSTITCLYMKELLLHPRCCYTHATTA